MAFDKHSQYGHLYPNLSEFDDAADEEIERIKQLSLITAAQDDERRRTKLCRDINVAGMTTFSNSLPQAIHESSSLPELLLDTENSTVGIKSAFDRAIPDLGDKSVSSQIIRPRPLTSSNNGPRSQLASDPCNMKTSMPPPLPSVGPNASRNRSVISPDVASFQRGRPEIPSHPVQSTLSSRSQSVSPPFRKAILEVKNPIAVPAHPVASLGFDHDAPLINLSPPYLRSQLDDFDLNDLDPLRQPSGRMYLPQSSSLNPSRLPVAHTVSEPTSVLAQQKLNIDSISQLGRASPLKGMIEPTYGKMWPTTFAAPNYGWNWATGVPVCNSGATTTTPPQSIITSRAGEVSIPGFDGNFGFSTSGRSSVGSLSTRTSDVLRSSLSSSNCTEMNSPTDNSFRQMPTNVGAYDLMDFSADSQMEPQYISLQDFDPLYLSECAICARDRCFDSDELFLRPDKSRLKASNVDDTNRSPTSMSEVHRNMSSAAQTSIVMQESIDELQDPFSVNDLTVSLEKKRQKHALEQEARAKQVEVSSVPKPTMERRMSQKTRHKESIYEMLEDFNETADGEIRAFLEMVKRIKMQCCENDPSVNPGIVISPRTSRKLDARMTVKIIVSGKFVTEPVVFTCDINATVGQIIKRVLTKLTDDANSASVDLYLLKVYGLSEYLNNDSVLSEYEYVQQCLKLDRDIRFIIVETDSVSKPFKRVVEDMKCPPFVRKMRSSEDPRQRVTKDKLNLLMETFYKEVEKLRDAAIQGSADSVSPCAGVVQAVKAICMVLHQIETIDVARAVKRLMELVKGVQTPESSYTMVSEDSEGIHRVKVYYPSRSRSDSSLSVDDLHIALEDITKAIKKLIDMYCRAFHTEFRFSSFSSTQPDVIEINNLRENLLVHVASAHRLPVDWKNIYTEYFVVCSIYHGSRKLCADISSSLKDMSLGGFSGTVVWDSWLTCDTLHMSGLPRESRLCLTLVGVRVVPATTNETSHKVNVPLGWVVMQLYNQQFELVQGSHLLCLWPNNIANPLGTNSSNTDSPNAILLQITLPDFDTTYKFPAVLEPLPSLKQDFRCLHPDDQEYLLEVIEKNTLTTLTEEEIDCLWEKRYYLHDLSSALPRVIQTINIWSWSSLREIYTMIKEWAPMPPLESLQLLLPNYPDTYVRNKAVDQLKELAPDDLYDLLPQLVQALKFECYHTSALAKMLLEKAAMNVRFAHYLYWLLKEAADDVHFCKRFQLLFGGLLSVVGEAMRSELSKQEEFIRMLSAIADKVKAGKDKEAILQRELGNMWEFYNQPSVRIPLNPALEVTGFDVKSCSYFTSFTCPLKLALKNADCTAGDIYVMFKAGDDLRQDMLTMQLIRIMDKLWLQDGLDLKMVTFRCQPTDLKRGVVELVMESDTLRKIQVKHGHGLAGSFKDRTITEWLQVHNPTELDFQKAVDNFTASCAGYCVATYVLGICDRHNDNIMIKHTGHIFHIDFAKFLGDSQTFGSFKRDRTPFVLTSDMAYVINGGDKPSERFQYFVDLCCRAFNIIRRNSNLFINLFSLMTQSGIPGVNVNAPKHIQKVLLPDRTDFEAVAEFTRMINICLQSIFTQVNFFIHNLAQMKFSGHEEGALLSFIPKTYTVNTDGRIRNLEMYSIQKRYNPEKHYVYIIKVERDNQRVPSFVMRRYSEFQELHRKLVMTFPLVRLPSLSGRVILGRAHVRTVAATRKEELQAFLKHLLHCSQEVAQHDLIYTFFHPMLKDEQDFDKTNVPKLRDNPEQLNRRRIDGSVKLNLFYKNGEMTVMVMHVKDLGPTSSGEAPNPYAKLYLLPDPLKQTKKKTKIAKNTFNPTYNEMFTYRAPMECLRQRTLQVLICSYDTLKENEFLGAVHLPLSDIDWTRADSTAWYRLQTLHIMSAQ